MCVCPLCTSGLDSLDIKGNCTRCYSNCVPAQPPCYDLPSLLRDPRLPGITLPGVTAPGRGPTLSRVGLHSPHSEVSPEWSLRCLQGFITEEHPSKARTIYIFLLLHLDRQAIAISEANGGLLGFRPHVLALLCPEEGVVGVGVHWSLEPSDMHPESGVMRAMMPLPFWSYLHWAKRG